MTSRRKGNRKKRAKITEARSAPLATSLPLATQAASEESLLSKFFGLDGLSFAFLAGTALALLSVSEFNSAGWFFILSAVAFSFKLTKVIDTKAPYQKLLVAILSAAVSAAGVNRVNNWVMSRQAAASEAQSIRTIVYFREAHDEPKKRGLIRTEPRDRANLHVVNVRIRAYAPDEQTLKRWTSPMLSVFLPARFPRTEAFIDIQNVGVNRALAPYIIRTAIIISSPLGPGEEDQLFRQRPEWQSGGMISLGNDWYPSETKQLHIFSNNGLLATSDWPDLIDGRKVFYVVTKAIYHDKLGNLPIAESCRSMSLKNDELTPCWGHNN